MDDDASLVRACRAGEPGAWAELVERFSRYVYAISIQAYRLAEHEAEDVFQEVFARAYEHLPQLRDDGAIRPWLGQLTRRLAVDRIRVRDREQPHEALPETPDEQATAAVELVDLAITIHDAMAGLPEHCREILDRFFAREQSYQEIAAALDIPMGTIASRISRCLTKLRAELSET